MVRNYLEIFERGFTGPKVSKEEWDVEYVVMGVQEALEPYDFSWDQQILIPEDTRLLENMYTAARDFIIEKGIFNISTSRIIELTEQEIDDGLKLANKELVMGEGSDAYTLVPRGIEDSRPPAIWAGNPGCPTPEHLFLPILKSIAKEPLVDLITCGSLFEVDGFKVRQGEPSEVAAVQREIQYVREALEQAGRSGMGLLGAESSITELGDIAGMQSSLLRPTDAHLVAMFNELILDRGNLVRAAASRLQGIRNASLACTMVGGFGGDAPGSTMLMMASMMAANVVCLADYHLCHPIHVNHISTTARSCLWLQSVLCQSFAKHAPAIVVCDLWPKSGALTRELLYEVAANALVVTVSGGHLEGVGTVDGTEPNGTGLEVRLMAEVARAATRQKMTRAKANEIAVALVEKYEHVFQQDGGNPGRPFDVAYDMNTLNPIPEWEAMYQEVKEELVTLGVDLERT